VPKAPRCLIIHIGDGAEGADTLNNIDRNGTEGAETHNSNTTYVEKVAPKATRRSMMLRHPTFNEFMVRDTGPNQFPNIFADIRDPGWICRIS